MFYAKECHDSPQTLMNGKWESGNAWMMQYNTFQFSITLYLLFVRVIPIYFTNKYFFFLNIDCSFLSLINMHPPLLISDSTVTKIYKKIISSGRLFKFLIYFTEPIKYHRCVCLSVCRSRVSQKLWNVDSSNLPEL